MKPSYAWTALLPYPALVVTASGQVMHTNPQAGRQLRMSQLLSGQDTALSVQFRRVVVEALQHIRQGGGQVQQLGFLAYTIGLHPVGRRGYAAHYLVTIQAVDEQRHVALDAQAHLVEILSRAQPEMVTSYELATGRLLFSNRQGPNPLGYAPDELANMYEHVGGLVHPGDEATFRHDLATLRRGGAGPFISTFRLRDKAGQYRTIVSRRLPLLCDSDGCIETALFLATDISQSLQARQEMERFRQRYRLATEAGAVGAWEYLAQNKCIYLDGALTHLFDLNGTAELSLLAACRLIGPANLATIRSLIRENLAQDDTSFEKLVSAEIAGQFRQILLRGRLLQPGLEGERLMGTCTDVTRTLAFERALAAADQDFKVLLNAYPDTFLRCNGNGRIAASHMGQRGLYPETLANSQGRVLADLFPTSVGQRLTELLAECLNQQRSITHEFEARVGEELHYFEARLLPVNKQELAIAIRNQTEEVLSRRSLIAAKLKAEQAIRAKDEFLSVISHEIRTPLNAIVGISHLLSQQLPGQPVPQELVGALKSGSESLLSLVNDILDFSTLQAGQVRFVETVFEPAALLEDVARQFSAQASAKGLELRLRGLHKLPPRLYADANRLRQVLANLVGNAIKFTDTGWVEIAAHAAPPALGRSKITLSVSDTGIGIPPEKHELIFQPFQQANSQTSRLYGGTGLGLSIVRNLVTLQGGRLWVESQPGQGSTFFIEISPELATADPKKAEPLIEMLEQSLQGLQVLSVDDVASNQYFLSALLKRWGADVVTATSGHQALALTADQAFDVVLMDIQMPGMDGYQATRHLRNQEAANGRASFVIALSADISSRSQERMRAVGADAFLSKPFEPQSLYNLLGKVLLEKNHMATATPVVEASANDGPAQSTFNLLPDPERIAGLISFDYFTSLYAQSGDQYQQMMDLYLQEYTLYRQNLLQALDEADEAAFRRIKHKIIYSLHLLGLGDLKENMEALALHVSNLTPAQRKLACRAFRKTFSLILDTIEHQRSLLLVQ